MNKPDDPARARLKALLKIPESRRSDEEWDEIHELEITLAQNAVHPAQHRIPVSGNTPPPARGNGMRPNVPKHGKPDQQQRRRRSKK